MGYTEAQVIGRVSTVLWDAATAIYSTAIIRQFIDKALVEVAVEGKPYIVPATVTTSAGTKTVDISGVAGLLHGAVEQSFESVEFRVDKSPIRKRNFEINRGIMALDIDFLPSASEDVRLLVRKAHVLSGTTTNTLDPVQEQLLIDLTVGRILESRSIDFLGETNKGKDPDIRLEARGSRMVQSALAKLRASKEVEWGVQYPRGA